MNFKGTKKLYIIKTCEQILYFNSIKHHIQFQYNWGGWGLGVGLYPPKISSHSPRSTLLVLPNFDQTMWFSPSLFQAWSKVLSPVSKLAGLALQSQNLIWAATQDNAFGLGVTQSVLLNGGSLKAYSLYTMHISLYVHFTVPDKKVHLYSLW